MIFGIEAIGIKSVKRTAYIFLFSSVNISSVVFKTPSSALMILGNFLEKSITSHSIVAIVVDPSCIAWVTFLYEV